MKVLIATDGSEFSRDAAKGFCYFFPNLNEVQIKIVSVYEEHHALAAEPLVLPAEYYQQLSDAARKHAGHFAAQAGEIIRGQANDGDLQISIEIINGPPEKEIIELARRWKPQLIVVGSHGRGFWGRILGSVSDAVVHNAQCTVMVMRKPECYCAD